ncbi:MAG: PP2C family protein-serine/threonine phosphatase [Candidatus Kapaibacterium sp.]
MSRIAAIINLESLLELSARLNETDDTAFILNSALLTLMGKLKILRAAVLEPEGEDLWKVINAKGRMENDIIRARPNIDEFRTLEHDSDDESQLYRAGFRYSIPVRYQDKLFALICLGEAAAGESLDTAEKHYAGLVSTITANAMQNAIQRISLVSAKGEADRRNLLLTTLIEISRDFSSLLSRDQILRMLAHRLMGQLMVSRFALLATRDGDLMESIVNRFAVETDPKFIHSIKKIEHITPANKIDDPSGFLGRVDARMVSPMKVQGRVKGYLIIGKKLSGEFSDGDLMFIEALGNTAIAALENERLFLEELKKKRIESELELALDIQKNLLPRETPDAENFEFYGFSVPSRYVGGDYFDFIHIDDNHTLIAIGDVSGKGMPASLIMASVQAALRALAPLHLDLREIITRINSIVYRNTSADKFVTFFMGMLNIENGEFIYINAGHNPPILMRDDGRPELLTEGGLILGIMEGGIEYSTGKVMLDSGDSVIMFTDGITEALDANGREYGEDRLMEQIVEFRGGSIREIMDGIIGDVRDFSRGAEQYDDITMTGIRAK